VKGKLFWDGQDVPVDGDDFERERAAVERAVAGDEGEEPEIIDEGDCPFCRAPNRKELEEGSAAGEITKKFIAEQLGMTPVQVYNHMMHHFTRFGTRKEDGSVDEEHQNVPNEIRKLYNKKDILFNLMVDLKERLDLYFTKDEFDASETTEIVRMVDAVRKLVDSLHALEKDLKTESDLVIKNYEALKGIILSKLCGPCRVAVMDALEEAEEKNEKIVVAEIKDDGKVDMPQWK